MYSRVVPGYATFIGTIGGISSIIQTIILVFVGGWLTYNTKMRVIKTLNIGGT